MSSLMKMQTAIVKKLLDLEPSNTFRMSLILDKALFEHNLIKTNELKKLDDIETKVVMLEGKNKNE